MTPRDRLFAFAQRLASARRFHALDTRHLYATVERDATGEWCAVAHLTGSTVHTDAGTMTVDGDAGVYAHGRTADAAVDEAIAEWRARMAWHCGDASRARDAAQEQAERWAAIVAAVSE